MTKWKALASRLGFIALTMSIGLLGAYTTPAESVGMISSGGTYGVPVVINGQLILSFTIDSGASDAGERSATP